MPPRYPKLAIRSKNELAKHISGKRLSQSGALALINDVIANFDRYWRDSKHSQPEKGKFVRDAKPFPLGRLLKLIDKQVLAPHDALVPDFIFGGISGKDHIKAGYHLLGKKRHRTLLGLDISTFFEQIRERRVFYFFHKKAGCSVKASRLLAGLCSVPLGAKGSEDTERSIGRGFATSTRLALWCNLDIFLRINWLAKERFKGRDPQIAIFVDDIGITASRVSRQDVEKFADEVEDILKKYDPNQTLPINPKKRKILSAAQGMEHLGLRLGRNKITPGYKTALKIQHIRNELKKPQNKADKKRLLQKQGAYYGYKRYIKSAKGAN
jgi:hypothetical protein